MLALLLSLALAAAQAPAWPAGRIIDTVTCVADPSQSYALYLPSTYTPDRAWPVLFLFDAGGRGRTGVDRYQAAAEQYGFIVAGSNNSRNGEASTPAVRAMSGDVFARFRIDMTRIYAGGMSGGARVAMGVALTSSIKVAGVMASSASYPDAESRKTVPFPVFATAGTEDFNLSEMRTLDRELTSPHRLAVFEGGHVWLTSALATEAVEWMEIQAMKSGLKPRDAAEIDAILARRLAAVPPEGPGREKDVYLALQAIADDFKGLKDVSAQATRATALRRSRAVRDALQREKDEDAREQKLLADIWNAEGRLDAERQRRQALADLRRMWQRLSVQGNAAEDSAERRLARRVMSYLSGSAQTSDPEYRAIVREFRRGGRGGR
jgi:poly(3-hydroxybutyrate) depolymerase